jgi:hypothetical protein
MNDSGNDMLNQDFQQAMEYFWEKREVVEFPFPEAYK